MTSLYKYFILRRFYDIIQNVKMWKNIFKATVMCALVLCACDLQPKISSIPDSIGMFIEDRYPALLADPNSQPEIYNSAVTDYGVYASPELYGSANIDDYVLYASVDDYVLVPESKDEEIPDAKTEELVVSEIPDDYIVVPLYGGNTVVDDVKEKKEVQKTDGGIIVVQKGDTLYSLARKNGISMSELAEINNLHEPYTLSIGQKLTTRSGSVTVKKDVPNVISVEKVAEIKSEKTVVPEPVKPNATTRVDLQEIIVAKGDTLYSLSRKYEIPVNDLAVMNKLSSPFTLAVGQKIKVPKLKEVKTVSVSDVKQVPVKSTTNKITPAKKTVAQAPKTKEIKSVASAKTTTKTVVQPKVATNKTTTNQTTNTKKISSNPKKQLPQIAARSGSKFSWPVRGRILSAYGAKNNGLFNDGINIAAGLGTAVKAAENGVVAYAGNEVKGMGNLIIIQHADGWMTIYAHLDSMSVKRGSRVNVGGQIGRVGKTGKVDQPQLHFEIRKGTKAYNPTQYLKK